MIHTTVDPCQAEFVYDDCVRKVSAFSKGRLSGTKPRTPNTRLWDLVERDDIPKQTDT